MVFGYFWGFYIFGVGILGVILVEPVYNFSNWVKEKFHDVR